MAYLLNHPKNYIHAIYSSSECLVWPIDRLITSINFASVNTPGGNSNAAETATFNFIDKSRLLADLGLNADQFLDTALLSGCVFSRTFPPIAHDFNLRQVLDLIRGYKSGIAVCGGYRQDPQVKAHGYIDAFMRARLSVKYSLIFTTEGVCRPLPLEQQPAAQPITTSDVPADLDEIFSQRLPDELYFHVCRGLICPPVIGWLSSGNIVETQPLADSPEYRRFIKDVVTEGHTAPRCTTLALLADALHPDWKRRRVVRHLAINISCTDP